MFRDKIIALLSDVPVVSTLLRKAARVHIPGSVTRIRAGYAAGLSWRRHAGYVNGYWVGIYELPIQQRIVAELRPRETFFDVGANAGFFCLVAAKAVGPAGRVVAFEPVPYNARVIADQFGINRLEQCTLVAAAVGDAPGIARMQVPLDESENVSWSRATAMGSTDAGRSSPPFYVGQITLDDFCAQSGTRPDLMKIDVEGAELGVLEGFEAGLKGERAPKLILETHGDEITARCLAYLAQFGYRVFTIEGEPNPDTTTNRHFLAYPGHVSAAPRRLGDGM